MSNARYIHCDFPTKGAQRNHKEFYCIRFILAPNGPCTDHYQRIDVVVELEEGRLWRSQRGARVHLRLYMTHEHRVSVGEGLYKIRLFHFDRFEPR